MPEINGEYDVLLTELLEDANNMRNRYDEFSQFMEAKIAEFVLERKLLAPRLGQLSQDLAITNAQRSQIQADLVRLTSEVERLNKIIDTLTAQRDDAHRHIQILEASRPATTKKVSDVSCHVYRKQNSNKMVKQYPVIITVRDRITYLKKLLLWLEDAGQQEIWLCDNASTYPPLVEFLKTTKHNVVYNKFNLGHRAPWLSGLVPELGHDRFFIISDPDVVPDEHVPSDVLEMFESTLRANPLVDKAGFSLRIDDLPDHYIHKADVITWESQFWKTSTVSGFFLHQ